MYKTEHTTYISSILRQEKPEKCQCGSRSFEIIKHKGGDGGIYLCFTCTKCASTYCMDFNAGFYKD